MTVVSFPFRIILTDGLWARTWVSIEPRRVDLPSRSFTNPDEAAAFADELSRINDWPIVDRRSGPEAA